MSPRIWIALGALSAAAAVGWGAYHAHGMEAMLAGQGREAADVGRAMHNFDVALRYQSLHAIGLILVGVIGLYGRCMCLDLAAFLFALGTLLFSACLETSALLDVKLPWFLVPAGGAAFIAGWIALAIGALKAGGRKEAPRESET
jgi:uncharacterized membrane protein YgdD (TMEM256/DUF423 family)